MKKIYITILEVGNPEAPNVGTISGSSEGGLFSKAEEALANHFDSTLRGFSIQGGLKLKDLLNSPPLDGEVVLADGTSYYLEFQQTFLY